MERERRGEEINNLYARLSNLREMQEKGWKVDTLVQEVEKQIGTLLEKFRQERLAELKQELQNEGERMSGTNS